MMDDDNEKEWKWMLSEMERMDEDRESVIKRMREGQKAAKAAVYALHRKDFKTAEEKLELAKKVSLEFLPLVTKNADLRRGTFSAAIEEYCEARLFYCFLKEGKLEKMASFDGLCSIEEYLGGISDVTGELVRYAVLRATERDVEAVRKCRDYTDWIMAHMMEFNLKVTLHLFDPLPKFSFLVCQFWFFVFRLKASLLRTAISERKAIASNITSKDLKQSYMNSVSYHKEGKLSLICWKKKKCKFMFLH